MNSVMFVFLILLTLEGFIVCDSDHDKVNYEGYQVWSADILGRNVSSDFIDKVFEKDVWNMDDNSVDFLINASETEYWKRLLSAYNISYKVLLNNVQGAIDKEEALKKRGSRRINWQSYAKLKDINSFLKKKADAHPKNCILKTIGKTAHNREIKMLKVTNGKVGNEAVLLEAGMHGREWLGVSSLLYFLDSITANFSALPGPLRHKDWYIIPVLNPDGYEYSMSTDRMWRKNRRRFSGPCDGVDINRNFETYWGILGSSSDICANDYIGPSAFSEAESIVIRNLMQEKHFTAYVSIHSFGNSIIYPWGATGKTTADLRTHYYISQELSKAMHKVHRQDYKIGTLNVIYRRKATGMSIDWVYKQGVVHSYLLKCGRGIPENPKDILHTATEVTVGLKRMAELI